MFNLPQEALQYADTPLYEALSSSSEELRSAVGSEAVQIMSVFASNPQNETPTVAACYTKYRTHEADLLQSEWNLLCNLSSLDLLAGEDRYRVSLGLRSRDLTPECYNTLLVESYTGNWSEHGLSALTEMLLQ